MKTIIWNENNKRRIEAELNEVQKRSKTRTIMVNDIQRIIDSIERKLNVKKKDLEGVRFNADLNAQDFPNAYRWTPESTIVCGIREKGKWRITSISRETTHDEDEMIRLHLPEATRAAIIKNHMYF